MNRMRYLAACAIPLCGWMLAVPAVHATGHSCSVSGSTVTSLGNYNPFSGSGFIRVPVTLNLTRYTQSGGGKTQTVDFYLTQPAGSPSGYVISYQNSNVLYTLPTSQTLAIPPPASGTVYYNFGGGGQPDTVSLQFVVTVPPGADLTAGNPISFNILYICNGTGGLNNVTTPTTLAQAITIQVNVLSALQASYAGPALSFGEISGVTNSQAPSDTLTGAIRVASTGPYTVALASTNGYEMSYPGGNLGTSAQRIKYSATLAGLTVDNANQNFPAVACTRAGVNGQNVPISVALEEGGQTKMPSPNYQDTLTVTVTPLATSFQGTTVSCQNLP